MTSDSPPPPPKPRNITAVAFTVGAALIVLGFGTCGFSLANQGSHSAASLATLGIGLMLAGLAIIVLTLVFFLIQQLREAFRK